MERLVILDYETGRVDIYPVEHSDTLDVYHLLGDLNHRTSSCEWMFTSKNIIFHGEVLKGEILKDEAK